MVSSVQSCVMEWPPNKRTKRYLLCRFEMQSFSYIAGFGLWHVKLPLSVPYSDGWPLCSNCQYIQRNVLGQPSMFTPPVPLSWSVSARMPAMVCIHMPGLENVGMPAGVWG